jgi:hypothetical protein
MSTLYRIKLSENAPRQSIIPDFSLAIRKSGDYDNTIIYYNRDGAGYGNAWNDGDQHDYDNCCMPGLTQGVDGNITNAPLFVDRLCSAPVRALVVSASRRYAHTGGAVKV